MSPTNALGERNDVRAPSEPHPSRRERRPSGAASLCVVLVGIAAAGLGLSVAAFTVACAVDHSID